MVSVFKYNTLSDRLCTSVKVIIKLNNKNMLLLWLLCLTAHTYGQVSRPGCIIFCGVDAVECLRKCRSIPDVPVTNPNGTLTLEKLGVLDTQSEITGSDMFTLRNDGLLYLTTRDGSIWRLIPKPIEGLTVFTKIYTLPSSFNLDTRGDKGLYDIAFLRNFDQSQTFYLTFAAYPRMGLAAPEYDHILTVAEFKFLTGEQIKFTKIIEELPQTVPYRSGGFMKGSSSSSATGHLPLWISSGGNQDNDPELLKSQPKYSSIYGIFPDVARRYRYEQELAIPKFVLWANGIGNPYECDYSALRSSRTIICLTRYYNPEHEFVSAALARVDMGGSGSPETSSSYSTTGYTNIQTALAFDHLFDASFNCTPDSMIVSSSNLLGFGFRGRTMIAIPTCEEEIFPETRMQIMIRNHETRSWVLVPMPIDFQGKRLWGVQLIGAELTTGLFIGGRDLFTGDYEVYWIKQKD